MGNVSITNFSAGMVQRTAPEDYNTGEVGKLVGLILENDGLLRSQWPIQTIAPVADPFYTDGISITAIYPLKSNVGTYLVAIKADGSLWYTKTPSAGATHTEAKTGDTAWYRLTSEIDTITEVEGNLVYTYDRYAENQGYNEFGLYNTQPKIPVEKNPDYRFITDLPFDVYKYIKKATNGNVNQFNKDEIVDTNSYSDTGQFINENPLTPKSTVSGVLIHSRRYVKDGLLTRGTDILSEKSIVSYSLTSNVLTINTSVAHKYQRGDTVQISIVGNTTLSGTYYIVSEGAFGATYFTVAKTNGNISLTSAPAGSKCFTISRTQVAVVAYIDPYAIHPVKGYRGTVKLATFPNIRRWPVNTTAKPATYASTFTPVKAIGINSSKVATTYNFIANYPYDKKAILNLPTSGTSAFPKDTNVFHPYTWIDADKQLNPGTGFIPRATIGTMWNKNLILGDIEWREDSSDAYLLNPLITPTASRAVMGTQYASIGLRDGNTEPHKGSLYFSERAIDEFDPRSVIRVSGTDTKIAGMHALNNRLVCVTTSGGSNDGVISFSGFLASLNAYTEGSAPNPFGIRKEIVKGGVGTADCPDDFNHGNPQTVLWQGTNKVAFLDRTGYVYTTDGATCTKLDERYPLKNPPSASTVNDHVAAVGNNLFIYNNGYLFCYTSIAGKGAWTILLRPEAWWQTYTGESSYKQYNIIKSMRGSDTELYMIVDTYYQLYNTDFTAEVGEPVLSKSRVMRYALNGPISERGMQDGDFLDGIEFETPTLGVGSQGKNVDWHIAQINFYTESGCKLNGIESKASYPLSASTTAVKYTKGQFVVPDPNLNIDFTPIHLTPIKTYTEGFYEYNSIMGIGPQKIVSVRYSFSGDVRINSVNLTYNGSYNK
jgi:hypothetical protein